MTEATLTPHTRAASLLNQLKYEAGRIADNTINFGVSRGASAVMYKRRKRPVRAALMGGLVVGALLELGEADLAEKLTIELARQAEDE